MSENNIHAIEVQDILKSIFHDVRGYRKSNQLKVCCPKCQERDGLLYPDGRYNLEINTKMNMFNCWKCESPKYSGTINRLVRDNGTYEQLKLFRSYQKIFYNDLSYLSLDKDNDYVDEDEYYNIEVHLPYEFILFKDVNLNINTHKEYYNYWVLDRQLPYEMAVEYNVGFCHEGIYKERIIIPSYNRYGELNYFVSRYIGSWEKTPKYINPKIDKSKFIFNESNVDWNSTIYLVEGVFDMFSLPKNTIPLLGKKMYSFLYNKISEEKPNIIIILDKDAKRDAINLYRELLLIYGYDTDKLRILISDDDIDIDEYRKKYGQNEMVKLLRGVRKLGIDEY